MNKIGLIIKREYLRRVSKRSFILMTFLTPILMVALIFVPLWLSSIKDGQIRDIVIIDTTGKYADSFENTDAFHFIRTDRTFENYRDKPDRDIFAILHITDDLIQNPRAATLYSEKQVPGELSRLVNQTIEKQMESEKMASFNIPNLKEIIRESQVHFNIQTIKWDDDGNEKISSAMAASIVGIVFTMLVYMFIMIYGAMVMQGVMEEKTNRIIEVMISSVRPFDLMMGKIIGIGFVGLTQVFLWGILSSVLILISGFLFGMGIEAQTATMGVDLGAVTSNPGALPGAEIFEVINSINFVEIGIYFILYFIGGYMLYAGIFAAIGSAVDHQEDTQQFMVPITLFLAFALYAGFYSMNNPDGPLAFWCSIIPFTSPIVMMIRIPFDIPLWEKLVSLALLYISFIGITWVSAKIYRVGILMYGKKPSIKEIVKWIKYK